MIIYAKVAPLAFDIFFESFLLFSILNTFLEVSHTYSRHENINCKVFQTTRTLSYYNKSKTLSRTDYTFDIFPRSVITSEIENYEK